MLNSMTPSAEATWPHAAEANTTTPGLWAQAVAAVLAYRAALSKRRHQRRARQDLERLDDRLLKDIGVTRGEIGYVVRYGRSR